LLDEKGEKLKSGRVVNLRSELDNFLSGIEEVKVVVEAGRSSYTMVDDMGIEVRIAHPKEMKAIAKAKIKTDKRDSWILAHLLRTDLIPEVYKRSRENRSYQRVSDSGSSFAAGGGGSAGDLSGKESFWHKGDEGARGTFITWG